MTPINPKNGAEVGHVSVLTVIVDLLDVKGVDGSENANNVFVVHGSVSAAYSLRILVH